MNYKLTSSQMNFSGNMVLLSNENMWNLGGYILFKKDCNYERLNEALNKLIESHEFVRLIIKESENGLVSYVKNYRKTNHPFHRFKNIEELKKFAFEYLTPLNLEDNLFNLSVFQLGDKFGYLSNIHHSVLDGYSMGVMADFIVQYLNDASVIKKHQSYQEYIDTYEKYKKSKRYITDKNFWLKQFSLNPQCSIFEEKKASFDYESDEANFRVPYELFNKIRSFCQKNNISIQSYFNTVYSIYIFRSLGTDFFTVGVPVLNRTTEAEFNTIGLYMHIVPLLVKISDDSFLQNALNLEDAQMNLFRHQKFTQYDIKELLNEAGNPKNNLFDIVSDYQYFEENEDYEFEFIYSNTLSVPLEIHMQSFGKEKHNLKIRYRTAMFTEKEIQTMINSIIAIAEDALENPDKRICDLEMIGSAEKRTILHKFNDTDHSYNIPDSSTIYSLFEKKANENEKKVCIKTSGKSLTFGELLIASENLDVAIRHITEGKKSIVAIIAERSAEMYAGIYGIIRGGNAYLPIDPEYPQERIDYIINNSSACVVLAQEKFIHLAKSIPCINVTEFLRSHSEKYGEVPLCAAEPNDTAYVIYTSGSTGNPKGAKVSHKSAVNRILWMHDKYPLGSDGVILQKTPYTFDVSVWEHFWWGMCGGSLAVSKPGEHFLPAKILDEVYKNKVTHLHFVPSVFELFLNYLELHKDETEKFDSVRYVFLSGEALNANLVQRFYKLYDYSKVSIHNLYGPTECAVDVTYYDCVPEDSDPLPIGKPIYNTQMYVVDKYMKPVPVGVIGELCIAGTNVGQGYLNNPDLTAEKFVDNPFGNGKLYRTGDNAYWREDGNIIFCGRIDGQIKLNGQRLEVGEIESVVSAVAEVESVAVAVRKMGQKDVLVAFYTGKQNAESKIKNHCREKLPKYMVPTFIVQLDAMPLNRSGKLDRRALSEIEVKLYEDEVQAPINDTERYICRVFEDVLSEKSIGRNSDFFEIGGTSYSMISLLSEDGFENITSADFMKNPTPALLATLLKEKPRKAAEYIETLYIPENPEQSLVLLPFAGGGAEAYSNLVASIKKQSDNTAIYFIRYLHSVKECEKAADEIDETLSNTNILVYSHCVGSAVALEIIKKLEENNCQVKHYFAGASVPSAASKGKNIWNKVSDNALKTVLSKAGAKLDKLSDENLTQLLQKFRNDTDFANMSYFEFDGRISTPVTLVLSKKDFFTLNYRKAEKLWSRYANDIRGIHFIDSKNHYFQTTDSGLITEIIFKTIR